MRESGFCGSVEDEPKEQGGEATGGGIEEKGYYSSFYESILMLLIHVITTNIELPDSHS